MAMTKLVSPSGWTFNEPIFSTIKIGSRGLYGNDRTAFLKRASHSFLNDLDNVKFEKDEIPVHLIALGASETWGPNRNGDGFKAATCRDYHNTFVKFAKFFRNHQNKPDKGDPHFGVVKASAYNEQMQRVELLCALNATKEAAARNGGFVADTELNKLARGDDLPVSMACRVPHDICSFCKHAARNREEYCTAEKCAAGGCRDYLAHAVKVGSDIHHLHVDNPTPTWFDISRVHRPADRIAYGAQADYLAKVASADKLFSTADYFKAANAVTAPLAVVLQQAQLSAWTAQQTAQLKLGYGLAQLEKAAYFNQANQDDFAMPSAFPVHQLAKFGSEQCAQQLAALADRGIFLSLSDYAQLVGSNSEVKAAASLLPFIYNRMTSDDSLASDIEKYATNFDDCLPNRNAKQFAVALSGEYSLNIKEAKDRAILRSLRCESASGRRAPKADVSTSHAAETLARQYGVYKLACLVRAAACTTDFLTTATLSLQQNRSLR